MKIGSFYIFFLTRGQVVANKNCFQFVVVIVVKAVHVVQVWFLMVGDCFILKKHLFRIMNSHLTIFQNQTILRCTLTIGDHTSGFFVVNLKQNSGFDFIIYASCKSSCIVICLEFIPVKIITVVRSIP